MVSFLNIFGVKGFSLILALGIGLLPGSARPSVEFIFSAPADDPAEIDLTKLSVGEIQQKAVAISGTWAGKRKSVQSMLSEAKSQKNIMRTNCIEPKAKSVDFWIAEGTAAEKDMKASAGQRDQVTIGFQKIAVIDTKIDEQTLQASRCIGDEKFSSGEGFELKASHPTEVTFDPDEPTLNFNSFVDPNTPGTIANPDWSVDLTWNAATPYY